MGARNLRHTFLLAAAAVATTACGRGDASAPTREFHLERWNAGGLPVVGSIDVTVRGFDADKDLATASGSVEIVCDPCALGDGSSKLQAPPRANARVRAFVGEGVTIDPIDLGMFRGELQVQGGRGTFQGRALGGPALEATIEGSIEFAPRVGDSQVEMHYLIRPTPEAATAAPQLATMLSVAGQPDATGALHFTLRGPLDRARIERR